jgi:hypothetical protein
MFGNPAASVPFSCSTPSIQMANGAAQDYRFFVATTTGYFAVENPDGPISVCRAGLPQFIPASQAVALWSCAGSDPRPAGDVTALDCHGLALTLLDVRGLAALKTLDCSDNQLKELELSGLVSLENLYCDQNPFVALDLSPCHSLAFLGYASRRLGYSGTAISNLTAGLVCHDGPLFGLHPNCAGAILNTTNDTLCAEKYLSARTKPVTPEQSRVREIAYALKTADPEAIALAAPAMAALITGPCWLVPIPASDGSLDANLALARTIAARVPGARVKLAIARSHPVESSTVRRRKGLCGLLPDEHDFVRTGSLLEPLPLFFVDNVITTGNTIRAARAVLGWGTGLAYADASSPFNTRPLTRKPSHSLMRSL